jgi:hypothetical protein
MIRPVTGSPLIVTSIKDHPAAGKTKLKFWPNPAKDYINIEQGELQLFGTADIIITDLNGHELIRVPYSERVDISSLHEGMYILLISTKGQPVAYNRIIKIR